jgi:hypothetical protein
MFSFEKSPRFSRKKQKKSEEKIHSDKNSFSDGDRVEHTSFGHGIVVSQNDEMYTIVFQKFGIKKIAKNANVWK